MLGSELEESACFQSQLLTKRKQHRLTYKPRVLYSIAAAHGCAEGGGLQTDTTEGEELT